MITSGPLLEKLITSLLWGDTPITSPPRDDKPITSRPWYNKPITNPPRESKPSQSQVHHKKASQANHKSTARRQAKPMTSRPYLWQPQLVNQITCSSFLFRSQRFSKKCTTTQENENGDAGIFFGDATGQSKLVFVECCRPQTWTNQEQAVARPAAKRELHYLTERKCTQKKTLAISTHHITIGSSAEDPANHNLKKKSLQYCWGLGDESGVVFPSFERMPGDHELPPRHYWPPPPPPPSFLPGFWFI